MRPWRVAWPLAVLLGAVHAVAAEEQCVHVFFADSRPLFGYLTQEKAEDGLNAVFLVPLPTGTPLYMGEALPFTMKADAAFAEFALGVSRLRVLKSADGKTTLLGCLTGAAQLKILTKEGKWIDNRQHAPDSFSAEMDVPDQVKEGLVKLCLECASWGRKCVPGPCPDCGGSRMVSKPCSSQACKNGFIPCDHCNGTGKVPTWTTDSTGKTRTGTGRCPECKGSRGHKCGMCEGRGAREVKCEKCRAATSSDYFPEDCTMCAGKSKQWRTWPTPFAERYEAALAEAEASLLHREKSDGEQRKSMEQAQAGNAFLTALNDVRAEWRAEDREYQLLRQKVNDAHNALATSKTAWTRELGEIGRDLRSTSDKLSQLERRAKKADASGFTPAGADRTVLDEARPVLVTIRARREKVKAQFEAETKPPEDLGLVEKRLEEALDTRRRLLDEVKEAEIRVQKLRQEAAALASDAPSAIGKQVEDLQARLKDTGRRVDEVRGALSDSMLDGMEPALKRVVGMRSGVSSFSPKFRQDVDNKAPKIAKTLSGARDELTKACADITALAAESEKLRTDTESASLSKGGIARIAIFGAIVLVILAVAGKLLRRS